MTRQQKSWLAFFGRTRPRRRARQVGWASPTNFNSHAARHRRLMVEPLEDRRLLAVFTVDNLNDAGLGSLREAIDDANANVGADMVEFQAGLSGTIALITGELLITDDLTIDGPGAAQLTIDAQQGSRVFHVTPTSGPVTIEGLHLTGGNAPGDGGAIFSETSEPFSITASTISGNSATGGFTRGGGIFAVGAMTVTDSTISGNSATRYGGGVYSRYGELTISSSTISGNSVTSSGFFGAGGGIATFGDVTVTDSTISGNSADGSLFFGYGGGIAAAGDVTVTDSTISGNSATGGVGYGGGIFTFDNVTVTDSTISGNSATGDFIGLGGGIFAEGDVTVSASTISGNSATGESRGAAGGGISSIFGDVTVISSTISGNSAAGGEFGYGGGIYVVFGGVTITNSTISGNSATGDSAQGGGIRTRGDVTVTGSTISGNSATGGFSTGGGIRASGDVTIENSIVAGNQTDTAIAPDLSPGSGPLTVRYSLIGDNTGTGLAPAPVGMPDANGNLIGDPGGAGIIDPMLGPLGDNGGPTFTHALLAGSPAINAGDPLFAPPPDFDQRGDPFLRVADGRIDMGAFELQPVSLDEKIQNLLDTGVLNRGQAGSLLVKLNPSGNERAQLNRLRAFINEVNALVRAGILSAEEGQCLINGAERLRNDLSVDIVLSTMGRRG